MNGEIGNGKSDKDADDNVESAAEADELAPSKEIDGDNVGDMSVELNVEELVAKVDDDVKDASEHDKAVRRRLDDIEEKRKSASELDSTFNFNLEDDL